MTELNSTPYIPILSVRPAEMNALRELPERDKDILLPAIQLRPWTTAKEFSQTISKVEEVYGPERNWIANLDCDYTEPSPPMNSETGEPFEPRQAVTEFTNLCNSDFGYFNWCEFVENHPRIIPCIQLEERGEFIAQVESLSALGRGLVLHLKSASEAPLDDELEALKTASENNQILFILDCSELRARTDINQKVGQWSEIIPQILAEIPNAIFAISSTSFPHEFDGVTVQMIRERALYESALATFDTIQDQIIYSDRGSARLQVARGGGGIPYARVDYPVPNQWYFYRGENRNTSYQEVAQEAIDDADHWNPALRIWGTQMIERTAAGDEEYGISSPAKATAVRINIHLHQQSNYNEPENLLDTDDEWVD